MNLGEQQINVVDILGEILLGCCLLAVVYHGKFKRLKQIAINFIGLAIPVFSVFLFMQKIWYSNLAPILMLVYIIVLALFLYRDSSYSILSGVTLFFLYYVLWRQYLNFQFAETDIVEKDKISNTVQMVIWIIFVFIQVIIIHGIYRHQVDIKKILEKHKRVVFVYLIFCTCCAAYFQYFLASGAVRRRAGLYSGCILIILFMSLIFFLYEKYKTKADEVLAIKEENHMLKTNYYEMYDLFNQNSGIYHDIKNHIFLLHQFLYNGETEKALKYMENIYQPVTLLDMQVNTNNQVIDCVLNYKMIEVKKQEVSIRFDTDRINYVDVRDEDLCSLVSNIMDNALDACKKIKHSKRFISVSIKKKNSMLVLKVKNSIDKKPIIKRKKIVTTKENKKLHGIGMENINRIAERYDGSVTYVFNEREFQICVVLNCSFH